jgi:hypothetical protein
VNFRHAVVPALVAIIFSFLCTLTPASFASATTTTPSNVNAYWGPLKGSVKPGVDITVWNGTTYQVCKTACGAFSATKTTLSLRLRRNEVFVSGIESWAVSNGDTLTFPWNGKKLAFKKAVAAYGTTATLKMVSAKLHLFQGGPLS